MAVRANQRRGHETAPRPVFFICHVRSGSNSEELMESKCRPGCPGGLNRSPQHFILEGKDGVWDGTEISSRFYCGGEDGVMESLEARRVAEGDWTSFWQAVIVDLFFGGSAWWDSSCPAAALQAGIDARGT